MTAPDTARFKQAGVLPDGADQQRICNGGSCVAGGKIKGGRRVRPAGWPAERGYRWPEEGEPAPGAGENHAAWPKGPRTGFRWFDEIDKRHVYRMT